MATITSESPLTEKPVWFITGCSTGFGRELARQVLERGYRTVVTARNPDAVSDLAAKGEALVRKLDVTDQSQIDAAIKSAEDKFGGIDVLVNNAGIGYFGAVEESEEDEVRRMFEINVFGLSRTIHAALPGMRERRKGFIVNFSSIGGLVSFPVTGYYHATKYAVEGLSESLWQEVEPLGIKVMLVEPSGFRTDWAGRSANEPSGASTTTRPRQARGSVNCAATPASNRAILCARHMRSSTRSSPRIRRTIFFLATLLTTSRWRSSTLCARSSLRGNPLRAAR